MKKRPTRITLCLVASSAMFACGVAVDGPAAQKTVDGFEPARVKLAFDARLEATRTPSPTIVKIEKPVVGGSIPDFGDGNLLFSSSGSFSFSTTAQPGSGSVTLAPVMDPNSPNPPASFGTGTWTNIQVAGASYSTTLASSITGVFPDPNGTDFLVVSAFTEEQQPNGVVIGTVLHVLVPANDFAIGASINLDGTDRVALFARGDISLPDPMVAAAAVTGTVTFTAGGLNIGNQVSLTVSGDFAEIQWNSTPPPPPPGTPITTGSFDLSYLSQVDVQCDGTLGGQTASFAALSASQAGFSGGRVQVAAGTTAGTYTVAGASVQSSLGASPFDLGPLQDAPPGMVAGYGTVIGSGPVGTSFSDTFFALDGDQSTATAIVGFAARLYTNVAGDGWCSTVYLVELTP